MTRPVIGITLDSEEPGGYSNLPWYALRENYADAVAAAIGASGRKVSLIKDSTGFVAQRILAMVANLGCEMAQIGIAEPEQIDLAMRLGLNYPLGPLQRAEELGLENLLLLLQRMQNITGDDRYRPSAWLRRRATLGLPIHTPD